MTQVEPVSRFQARLRRPASPGADISWAFLVLPPEVSKQLPRRGRTTVEGTINDCAFSATLEPDGQRGHWLTVSKELQDAAGVKVGETVTLAISPVKKEPEPEIPADLQAALAKTPDARAVWDETTTIARIDWIHWITSAKQAKTRTKRINDACEMLAGGKKRVCCFDPSGYYSKAFRAPEAVD